MIDIQRVRPANDNIGAALRAPTREAYERAGELVALAHANIDPDARAHLFRKAAEALTCGAPREPVQ
jgi:hypothetical protein